MLKSSDKRYEEERVRRERMESENMLLRRDVNKLDIRCKALQRYIYFLLTFHFTGHTLYVTNSHICGNIKNL